jgi:PilZ domain
MTMDRRSERAPRIAVAQDAVLITSSGQEVPIRLSDLSREGFKIEHPEAELTVGEIITIPSRRSEAKAKIRWVQSHEAGGIFIDSAKV